MCVELGRLTQGFKDTQGTNTCEFMSIDTKRLNGDLRTNRG